MSPGGYHRGEVATVVSRRVTLERNASGSIVSVEEVALLARLAGLDVGQERLLRLRDEFEATLLAVDDLEDAANRCAATEVEPFDAAWPTGGRR